MTTRGFLAAASCAALLSGCLSMPPERFRTHYLHEKFDLQEMRQLLAPGALGFSGTAFLRQQGGGVVTCAGFQVFLTPATAYARERVLTIYGTEGPNGYTSLGSREVRFEPSTPELELEMRTATCDAQGNFQFTNLKAGSYYVSTVVTWMSGYRQGGALMARVSLRDGETPPKVIMAGQ